jgi:hypothetical protein
MYTECWWGYHVECVHLVDQEKMEGEWKCFRFLSSGDLKAESSEVEA